jgi:diguanylate cyclase (GGDEF)-like protein/PAS domain S-box-containing protein
MSSNAPSRITETQIGAGTIPLEILLAIFDRIDQGILVAGPDQRILYVNQAACRVTGFTEDEFLGRSCRFLQGSDTDRNTIAEIKDRLNRGAGFRGTILNYRKNGEAFWNDLAITPLLDQAGRVSHFIGLQRDISVGRDTDIEPSKQDKRDHFVLDHMLAGVVVHALDTTILYANSTAERLLGVNPGESIGAVNTDPRWGFLREDGSVMPIDEYPVNQALATQGDIKNLVIGVRRGGEGIRGWLMCNAYPELDGLGQPIRVIVSFTDVTELKQAERSLKLSEERLQLVLRGSQDASWDWDLVKNQLYYSPRWWQMLGYDAPAFPPTPTLWRSLIHPNDAGVTLDKFNTLMSGTDEAYELEFRLQHRDGHYVPVLSRGFILRDSDNRPLRVSGTNTDLTERKHAEERIHNLAFYDPLTNLANRRLLAEQLRRALLASERNHQIGAILFIDLDNFKSLNDTLGHDVGDKLLQEVAQRLKNTVRQSDLIARLGGDEFLIMIEDLGASQRSAALEAEQIGTHILEALSQRYTLDSDRHFSTASIGIALFGQAPLSVEALLKQADLAMYKAKEEGRNRLRFFDSSLQIAVDRRVALEKDLRDGLERGEMTLFAQPQIRDDGTVVGAELLIRWQHPQRGLVSPADFIPLAEATGLILPLGRWVISRCCQQLTQWADDETLKTLSLAVNISIQQFREPDFDEQVIAIIEQFGTDPQRLKLELTESLLAENVEDVIAKMNRLRRRGIRFSLDDFGTGYSSLSYLKRLPLEQLKIDQSFVRDVLSSPHDAAIAGIIISLSEKLGLDVIAEGVETVEQRQFLLDNGCHIFQGYLLGRPMEISAFEQFCRSMPKVISKNAS